MGAEANPWLILQANWANDPANPPNVGAISSELYGGGPELRLKQELLLKVCSAGACCACSASRRTCANWPRGARRVRRVGERSQYLEEMKRRFHEGLAFTRAGSVFTTHTAVAAGFDRFSPQFVRQYLSEYARRLLRTRSSGVL